MNRSQQYYDLIYSAKGKDYKAEAAEIVRIIREHNPQAQTVLDVGCGTGQHARVLRGDFNFQVDGVDLDADMIDFDFPVKCYDAVISMFSAIGYVRTPENVTKALSRMRAHVKDDGVVIVEPWFTPDAFRQGNTYMDTVEDGTLKLCRMARNEVKDRLSCLYFYWTVCRPDAFETFEESLVLGLFTKDEMLSCFEAAGLEAVYNLADNRLANRGLYIARPA